MNIRQINLEARDSDIFKNFEIEGDEVVRLTYSKQVDDVMISLEGGDALLRWDTDDWIDDECILLKEHDNLKEIGKISITHLLIKSKTGSKIKVYVVAQLN